MFFADFSIFLTPIINSFNIIIIGLKKLQMKTLLPLIFLILQCNCQIQQANSSQSDFQFQNLALPLLSLSYPNSDIQSFRSFVYEENLKLIEQHNADINKKYQLQANYFASFTEIEIKANFLTLIPSSEESLKLAEIVSNIKASPLNTASGKIEVQLGQSDDLASFSPRLYRDTLKHQQSVIKQIKQNLESRNLSIQLQLIEQRRLINKPLIIDQMKVEKLVKIFGDGNMRRLQQTENNNQKKIQAEQDQENYDVDWTCLSGTIRAQGQCGCCYAIAALDAYSSLLTIYNLNFYLSLSIQEILDCTRNSMTLGCHGGFIEGAYAYMRKYGVASQYAYPYREDSNLLYCKRFSKQQNKIKIRSFHRIQRGNCLQVKKRLQIHPLPIGIDGLRFMFYKKGTFDSCSQKVQLNHAVVLVGYKKGKGWRIKNSWSSLWGQGGYGWIDEHNNCGICNMAFSIAPDTGYLSFLTKNQKITCPRP